MEISSGTVTWRYNKKNFYATYLQKRWAVNRSFLKALDFQLLKQQLLPIPFDLIDFDDFLQLAVPASRK